MTPWHERSREEKALLNPAFCSLLLWHAARGYTSVSQGGLSFEESFLILPMILHRKTREALPRDARTSLAVWFNHNPLAHSRIATSAKLLVPFTKEGMLFGGIHGFTKLAAGSLYANEDWQNTIKRSLRASSKEVRFCVSKAEFVCKWFAQTGNRTLVLALIGVCP